MAAIGAEGALRDGPSDGVDASIDGISQTIPEPAILGVSSSSRNLTTHGHPVGDSGGLGKLGEFLDGRYRGGELRGGACRFHSPRHSIQPSDADLSGIEHGRIPGHGGSKGLHHG